MDIWNPQFSVLLSSHLINMFSEKSVFLDFTATDLNSKSWISYFFLSKGEEVNNVYF